MSVYGLTPYEPGTPGGLGNVKGGGHPTTGLTRGQERPLSVTAWDKTEEDEEPEDLDDDFEEFVRDEVRNKIIGMSDTQSQPRVDLGARGKDAANFVTNVGGIMMENHTTVAMKGLSPRMTYRSNSNSKGPAMGVQGSAMYIRSKPGRQDGTLDGWGHAPRPKFYEDDENIWSLSDINIHDNAINRQNRIKKYIQSLEDN